MIAKSKSLAPVENNSEDSSDDDEQDEQRGGMVNCISCGKDVSTKVAIRHMESCFNKFESQTSYGSMYKTKIEGYQMVCDFYNPLTGKCTKKGQSFFNLTNLTLRDLLQKAESYLS